MNWRCRNQAWLFLCVDCERKGKPPFAGRGRCHYCNDDATNHHGVSDPDMEFGTCNECYWRTAAGVDVRRFMRSMGMFNRLVRTNASLKVHQDVLASLTRQHERCENAMTGEIKQRMLGFQLQQIMRIIQHEIDNREYWIDTWRPALACALFVISGMIALSRFVL